MADVNITCITGSPSPSQDVNAAKLAGGFARLLPGFGGPQPSRSELQRAAANRICERFIYLAATPSNREVKAGLSEHPVRRVAELACYGKVLLYANARPGDRFTVRLARAWSLGIIARHEALQIERHVHQCLREAARWHGGEWYRLATRTAETTIDRAIDSSLRRTA